MSYLAVFGVLTGVGVDVSKFFGAGARVFKRGTGAESKSEKCDSAHLCHGLLNSWQTCLVCLPRQNICWDYFAFCGTWLVEVVISCYKQNIQSYMI